MAHINLYDMGQNQLKSSVQDFCQGQSTCLSGMQLDKLQAKALHVFYKFLHISTLVWAQNRFEKV